MSNRRNRCAALELVLRKLALTGLMALTTVACGAAAMEPRTAYAPLSASEIQALIQRVSRARQLQVKRPVRIQQLPPGRFAALVEQAVEQELARSAAKERQTAGFLLGFNLIPPPEQRDDIASMRDVLNEQIAGFYDKDSDSVFVNDTVPEDEEQDIKRHATLAHEVHHALQAQHFDMGRFEEPDNDDAALAYQAVVEGDAMVAMGAYLGASYGAPIRRTLRRITDVASAVRPEDMAPQDAGSQLLRRALPIARERLVFPYFEGMRFVADLYRAGGFALVDRLYHTPPVSTAQILHPQKYIDGIVPLSYAEPKMPAGHRPVDSGRLGELQLSVMLSRCLPRPQAADAAAGWAGDRYAIGVNASGSALLLWRTSWETEQDAAAFERALLEHPKCWTKNELVVEGARMFVDHPIAVRRGDLDVAVVRGAPPSHASTLLEKLLELAAERPEHKPIGEFVIPPRTPLPEPRPGRVRADVYRSEWLGLTGRLPSGMRVTVASNDYELQIDRLASAIIGRLVVSDRVANEEFNRITFAEIAAVFSHAVGGRLHNVSAGRWRSPLGEAVEQIWMVEGSRLHVRAILIPICEGTGSLVFLEAFADPYARHVLDGWLASFRFTGPHSGRPAPPPVCERLNPR